MPPNPGWVEGDSWNFSPSSRGLEAGRATSSNEGDWVLDLFSSSGKFYYTNLNLNILFFTFYVFILIFLLISFVLDD